MLLFLPAGACVVAPAPERVVLPDDVSAGGGGGGGGSAAGAGAGGQGGGLAGAGGAGEAAVELCAATSPGDPYRLEAAEVEGDELLLQVWYGGGCGEHQFRLCWDGAFQESLPVRTRLTPVHVANDDRCNAGVIETLRFRLDPLRRAYLDAYRAGGTVVLTVAASEERAVDYSF